MLPPNLLRSWSFCAPLAMGAFKTLDFDEGSSNKSTNSNFSRNVFQTCKEDVLATPNTINLSSCINRGMSERRDLHKTYESMRMLVRTCAAFWVYVYNFQLKCTLSCSRCNCVLTARIINGCGLSTMLLWHQFIDFFVVPNYMIIENRVQLKPVPTIVQDNLWKLCGAIPTARVFASWLENVYIDAHFGFCENLLKCLHLLKNRSLACHVDRARW